MINGYQGAAIPTAALAIVGFYLVKLGVASVILLAARMHEGNYWALLLVPFAAGILHLALRVLRNVAAEMAHR